MSNYENEALSELVANGIIEIDEMDDYRGFVRRAYNRRSNSSPDEITQDVANDIMSSWSK